MYTTPILKTDDVEPRLGRFVHPDGWSVGANLESSDWAPAAFRLPTNNGGPITSLAVNIKVSGRKLHIDSFGTKRVRVAVIFVGDCEPDIPHVGWMYV